MNANHGFLQGHDPAEESSSVLVHPSRGSGARAGPKKPRDPKRLSDAGGQILRASGRKGRKRRVIVKSLARPF